MDSPCLWKLQNELLSDELLSEVRPNALVELMLYFFAKACRLIVRAHMRGLAKNSPVMTLSICHACEI